MGFITKVIKSPFYFIRWIIWDFSTLRFFWEKIRPPIEDSKKRRRPSTILLWIVGMIVAYVALFVLVSQRYENRLLIIENRANSILTQLSVPETNIRKNALSRISTVQNMTCPYEPVLFEPVSIYRSVQKFADTRYDDIVESLKQTVESWKDHLGSINLEEADLRNAKLDQAKLSKAILTGSELGGINLVNADLRGAVLSNVNLTDADLRGADLSGARIDGAILQGADLRIPEEKDIWKGALFGRDPEWTKRSGVEQLCTVKTLYKAKLDPELVFQIKETCPHLLEKPEESATGKQGI
jgi:hypothetical protein